VIAPRDIDISLSLLCRHIDTRFNSNPHHRLTISNPSHEPTKIVPRIMV
jgi:hypothetical protein